MAEQALNPQFSRRALFRAGGYAAAGAALSTLPFGRSLLAHDVSEAWPNVSAMAKKYVAERKVANMLLTFGWGQEDHAHTVGGGKLALAGGADVDENSLYRIYSMTKPVTGMAIMMLIDEGKLGLDQPLYDIIPAFKDMQVLVDPKGAIDQTVPAEKAITIRHLLTHTAGLDYVLADTSTPLLKAYAAKGVIGGQASKLPNPTIEGTPANGLETMINNLASLPLRLQPGQTFHYSMSIDVLGRVIEVVSGQTLEQFFKTRFFDPMGMTSTYFTVPKKDAARLTTNYLVMGEATIPIDPLGGSVYEERPPAFWGGSGLVSSPKDYDRFLRMVLGYGKLGKERIMGELAVRVGVSNLFPKGVNLKGTWMDGQGHGAGGRSVNGTYGWGGAAGTLGAVDFNLGLRTALWTQYMPSDVYSIRDEYLAAMEKDLAEMRAAKAKKAA